jgi:SAM-dependent methyltransferase
MGLGGQAIDAIGREHAYRPIAGDVLFIGRQTVYFSPQDLARRLRDHLPHVDEAAIEVDRTTLNRNLAGELATDRSIFRALGLPAARIKALDVSPYEGAEVIHDLNQPIPDALRASADFIVDGSTLDNVFDPAMALRNYAELLRPGGRLLAVNAWNLRDSAYTACSPSWYLDYFAANGFADCKVYVCVGARRGVNVYWLDPAMVGLGKRQVKTPIFATWWRRPFVLVLAEQSATPGPAVVPTQADYRGVAAAAPRALDRPAAAAAALGAIVGFRVDRPRAPGAPAHAVDRTVAAVSLRRRQDAALARAAA